MMKNRIRRGGAQTLTIVGILLLTGCLGALTTPPPETVTPPKTVTVDKAALTVNVDSFAAIAFSPRTKKWYMLWDVESRRQAIDVAMEKCEEKDCRPILVYGPGVCGTFSLGTNNAMGIGAGRTPREAKESALADCSTLGGNCKAAQPRCNR